MELQSFTIDDPIELPIQHAIDVTLQLTSGERRWCCFATPESLAVFGDFLNDTQVRVHYGLPHMIVLQSVSPETIDAALKQIDAEGGISAISKSIELNTKDSVSDIWVFNGSRSNFPSALYRSKPAAEKWIRELSLNGTLTRYPIEIPVYDWAMKHDLFTPKRDDQRLGEFIGRFTSASQEHYHYEHGKSCG